MQPLQTKWQLGIHLINKGVDKYEANDLISAGNYYERGIQLLIDSLKKMPNSNRKFEKQQQINTYLELLSNLRKPNNNNVKYKPKPKPNNNYNQSQFKQNKYNNYNKPIKKRTKHQQDLYDRIQNEILSNDLSVKFTDVIGLENVKQALLEAVILPAQRPDIFVGPRSPPKGLLLFGPPGNGKTFIAKALASECNATFFCISSASLTSRYVGEGEKLVRALFECARDKAPSIIFIDEIDSLLTSRGNDNEQESSRRMKTEFLVQLDGVQSSSVNNVLLVGATNIPWDLDDAVLRRFPKRILVPKPNNKQRYHIIKKILFNTDNLYHTINDNQIKNNIVPLTKGYSASDLKNLCNDACMGPIRDIGMNILNNNCNLPPVTEQHFQNSLGNIKPSTNKQSDIKFNNWNKQFGTILKLNKKNIKSFSNNNKGKNKGNKNKNKNKNIDDQKNNNNNNNNNNLNDPNSSPKSPSFWTSFFQ